MYDDLVAGSLLSPGLVDTAFLSSYEPSWWYSVTNPLRLFLIWAIDLMVSLSTWIRSTPIVLSVISFLFVGFLVSLFFRVYHSF